MHPGVVNKSLGALNGSVRYGILPEGTQGLEPFAPGVVVELNDSFHMGGGVEGGCRDPWGTTCIEYPGQLKQLPQWEVAIKILFYVVTIVVSIVGNVLVIFIVWKNKRMRTTTNYYIVNLAVSDLMVTLTCTWVHLVSDVSEGWVLGAFFCKFNSFAQG